MDSRSTKPQQRTAKSDANLVNWILRQCELHRTQGHLTAGAPLKIAIARKAVLRSGLPEALRDSLLGATDEMLKLHKNAAIATIEFPSSESGLARLARLNRRMRLDRG
jgi:hypothetical protein